MNTKTWTRIIALALFATLAIPGQLFAQRKAKQDPHHQYHHYQLIDMGTFGGPQSYDAGLNNHGTFAGWADTPTPDPFLAFCFNPDCFVSHAFQWQNEVTTDLGVLPHGWSSASTSMSASGLVSGFSQNGKVDPLFPGFPEARAVLWAHGKIVNLGTLDGGHESAALAVNSQGQVVGGFLNTTPDSNAMTLVDAESFPPIPYQARAFLWDEQKGMRDLGTLPGGADAQATSINEAGQVAGVSYTSSAPSPACANQTYNALLLTTGSFLWDEENGMVDLGSLGGTCTLAIGLNKRGQVVGKSFLPGDQSEHAFLWDRKNELIDLGTLGGDHASAAAINDNGDAVGGSFLPGDVQYDAALWKNGAVTDLGTVNQDPCADAFAINGREQIVGASWDCISPSGRGFLWEDGGPMVDLNTLVSSGSGLYVAEAHTINDGGEIAGIGQLPNGQIHAVLLIPCDEHHPGVEGCDYSLVDATTATAPSAARPYAPREPQRLPQSRWTNRYHIPGLQSPGK